MILLLIMALTILTVFRYVLIPVVCLSTRLVFRIYKTVFKYIVAGLILLLILAEMIAAGGTL